jgi:Protein of unknown function (DUF1064)
MPSSLRLSKYRAVRTNGYASKAEARRAQELELLRRCGEVSDIEEQVIYELIPKQAGERAICYVADFRYKDKAGNVVVEDVKGFKTAAYLLKRKLMLYVHGVKITEV